jgi:hypothetical protein
MSEDQQYPVLSLLKENLRCPAERLEQLYWGDPVFRQIAREYRECFLKQKTEIAINSILYESYTQTIRELEEELLEHLKN